MSCFVVVLFSCTNSRARDTSKIDPVPVIYKNNDLSPEILDLVTVTDVTGIKYTGVINNINDGKYQIMYPDGTKQWLKPNEFSVNLRTTTSNVSQPKETPQANQEPERKETKVSKRNSAWLTLGEYATYSYAHVGRITIIAGMGFTLREGGKYYDLDNSRPGTYDYDPANATITFHGGIWDGQVGKEVTDKGFHISETVVCEIWK